MITKNGLIPLRGKRRNSGKIFCRDEELVMAQILKVEQEPDLRGDLDDLLSLSQFFK